MAYASSAYASSAYGTGVEANFGEGASQVELHISCSSLANMDTFSKSDPQVFVFEHRHTDDKWLEVGRTEMIKDNLNPKFAKSIKLVYHFEAMQPLRFVVVDVDKTGGKLEDQDLIGTLETSLAEIVGSTGQSITQKITSPRADKKAGYITIAAEEVQDMRMSVKFNLEGIKLDRKDFFGRSDPFLRISRKRANGKWSVVHKTEAIHRTLNPVWKPFAMSMQKLCNGDMHRPLRFECLDWNRSGKEDYMGAFETTLAQLVQVGANRGSFDLVDEGRKAKKGRSYKGSGHIRIIQCEMVQEPSFLDYIRGGCEINLMVAIDFTASNGKPEFATSLHYNNPYKPNDYVQAIRAVGEVLANYDMDKRFPSFGFGAKIPPHDQVSHCFPLNGNPSNPEVVGVDGILQAYRATLERVKFLGPTNMAEIIRTAANMARDATTGKQAYIILLIITDGAISDMQRTVGEIVAASDLPLSIVIVGVGNADFAKMDFLDADDEPLVYNGRKAARDIVQFVPFNEYKNLHYSKVAEVTLKEIPGQLLSYFNSRGIKPNPPLVAPGYRSGAMPPQPAMMQGQMPGQPMMHGQMPGQPMMMPGQPMMMPGQPMMMPGQPMMMPGQAMMMPPPGQPGAGQPMQAMMPPQGGQVPEISKQVEAGKGAPGQPTPAGQPQPQQGQPQYYYPPQGYYAQPPQAFYSGQPMMQGQMQGQPMMMPMMMQGQPMMMQGQAQMYGSQPYGVQPFGQAMMMQGQQTPLQQQTPPPAYADAQAASALGKAAPAAAPAPAPAPETARAPETAQAPEAARAVEAVAPVPAPEAAAPAPSPAGGTA